MKNNLYTIPAALPFADTLAQWVLSTYGSEPLALPRILMLLPSRRAARALHEAFLRATDGKPLLLPRMQPLGDTDEDMLLVGGEWLEEVDAKISPPGFEMKRLFVLARLIHQYTHSRMDHALRLAQALAVLLDELEREQLTLEGISALVTDEFAKHWQVTVEFLRILSEHWPRIAEEEGLISPQAVRSARLAALSKHWQSAPPEYPVIAAGTTGSIPATAQLLKTILTLPQGSVVLPGFDTHTSQEYYDHIDESHPQFGMRHLLAAFEYDRADVQVIGATSDETRSELLAEITRPAETSHAWQKLSLNMQGALSGIKRVVCASIQEEATVIALMLRQTLETPGKTAALVTHNRDLARRVQAIMTRFEVVVDDSAGTPLAQSPAASFLRLILEVAESNLAVVPTLSLLKHPFARAGMERADCLEATREIEIENLRGVFGRQWPKAEAMRDKSKIVKTLHANVEILFAPLLTLFNSPEPQTLSTLIAAHLQCAESLAGEQLWSGQEADAILEFIADLEHAPTSLAINAADYLPIFETLLLGKVFRAEYGTHPRIKILSPIEARMQAFDRIILGDLNEGSWPAEIMVDPWFNRAMRKTLGLPAPERKIGLAAHDFVQLASCRHVFLTRAEKIDGVPTTPARWLVKLDVLCKKYAVDDFDDEQWKAWAIQLNAAKHVTPSAPPTPKPPVSARPQKLSVTQIETWMRDPYSIYASQILRLKKLEPLGAEPTGADFGNAVHKALELFGKAFPEKLPADALKQLCDLGHKALEPFFFSPAVEAFWWPRFVRIAEWLIAEEQQRRAHTTQVLTEVEGSVMLDGFTLHGRADRVEERKDGGRVIVDYKTGVLPKRADIEEGLASQLVLLGIIMGGEPTALALEYWQLQGGKETAKIQPIKGEDISTLIEEAKKGLLALIEKYNDPGFPYLSTPLPSRAKRYNDFEHLARVKEWS